MGRPAELSVVEITNTVISVQDVSVHERNNLKHSPLRFSLHSNWDMAKYNAVQYSAVPCGAVQCSAVQYVPRAPSRPHRIKEQFGHMTSIYPPLHSADLASGDSTHRDHLFLSPQRYLLAKNHLLSCFYFFCILSKLSVE